MYGHSNRSRCRYELHWSLLASLKAILRGLRLVSLTTPKSTSLHFPSLGDSPSPWGKTCPQRLGWLLLGHFSMQDALEHPWGVQRRRCPLGTMGRVAAAAGDVGHPGSSRLLRLPDLGSAFPKTLGLSAHPCPGPLTLCKPA